MSSKLLFLVTAVISFRDWIAALFMLDIPLRPFGIDLDASGFHIIHLNGSYVLGLDMLLWLAKDWRNWWFIRLVAVATFVTFIIKLVVVVLNTASGLMNSLGWANASIDALVTLAFGYLLFVRKAPLRTIK